MTHNLAAKRQRLLTVLQNEEIHDSRVLDAIAQTPRELFVSGRWRTRAYNNQALPIELGQTISQPRMVAIMTQALQLAGSEHVLEIGTGSGYQTAILARLAARVTTIERHPLLAHQARRRLTQLELTNVECQIGDGSLGWPEQAPYQRILVTAGAPEVPEVLLEQLVLWGSLVIPVGPQERQELLVVHRAPWGQERRSLGACVFVPLLGEAGWDE